MVNPSDTKSDNEDESDTSSSSESEQAVINPIKTRNVRFREDTLPVRTKRRSVAPQRFTMTMGGDSNHPSEFAASMTPLSADSELLLDALIQSDHTDPQRSQHRSPSSTFFSRRILDVAAESSGRTSSNDIYRPVASATSSQKRPPAFTGSITPQWHLCDRKFKTYAQQYGMEETKRAYLKELNGIISAGVLSELVGLPRGHRALPLISIPS